MTSVTTSSCSRSYASTQSLATAHVGPGALACLLFCAPSPSWLQQTLYGRFAQQTADSKGVAGRSPGVSTVERVTHIDARNAAAQAEEEEILHASIRAGSLAQ